MEISPEALSAILGMAAVTIAIKAGGLLLASRLPSGGFAADWLRHIPGAVLAALIAPAIFSGRVPEAVGAVATTLAYMATRSLLPAMLAGVLGVWIMRQLLGA